MKTSMPNKDRFGEASTAVVVEVTQSSTLAVPSQAIDNDRLDYRAVVDHTGLDARREELPRRLLRKSDALIALDHRKPHLPRGFFVRQPRFELGARGPCAPRNPFAGERVC